MLKGVACNISFFHYLNLLSLPHPIFIFHYLIL